MRPQKVPDPTSMGPPLKAGSLDIAKTMDRLSVGSPASSISSIASANIESLRSDLVLTNQALQHYLNADFSKAIQLIKPHANESMYCSLGMTMLLFSKSLFTFDDEDVQEAHYYIDSAASLANKVKKAMSASALYSRMSRIFGRRQSSSLSNAKSSPAMEALEQEGIDLLQHAELVIAEVNLIKVIMDVITDNNGGGWMLLARESLTFRSCYLTYRSAFHRLARSGANKDLDYVSGILLGNGLINLIFSILPSRIFNLVSFFGYSGSVVVGISQLKAGAACANGLRSPICELVLLLFFTVLSGSFVVRHGQAIDQDRYGRIEVVQEILDARLRQFPSSPIYLYFLGRFQFLQHKVDDGIVTHEEAIAQRIDYSNLKHAFYWDLLLGYMITVNWPKCEYYATLLATESGWSKCFCTYLQAIYLHASLGNKNSPKIRELLFAVPKLQKRIVGRNIPIEKFVSQRAKAVLAGTEKLFFPEYELILVWDNYAYMSEKHLETSFNLLGSALEEEKDLTFDNIAFLKLSLGVIKRVQGDFDAALEYFSQIEKTRPPLANYSYIPVLTDLETAVVYSERGERSNAVRFYDKAVAYPTKYTLSKSIEIRLSKFKLELDKAVHNRLLLEVHNSQ